MSKPKILTLDIETRPNLVYTFSLRKAYIGVEQIVEPTRIIACGAKWLGQKNVMYWDDFKGTTDAQLKRHLLRHIHRLWSQADAIVGKNSNRFDLPKLYGEFAKVGLPPPPPVASIDMEKVVRGMGLATSKLAFVAPYFGAERKHEHDGFTLWRDYMNGRAAARREMREYCKQDVRATESLYLRLKPYIKEHPYFGERAGECPNCGSRDLQHRGYRRTRMFQIERLHCQSCGAWSSGTRRKV